VAIVVREFVHHHQGQRAQPQDQSVFIILPVFPWAEDTPVVILI